MSIGCDPIQFQGVCQIEKCNTYIKKVRIYYIKIKYLKEHAFVFEELLNVIKRASSIGSEIDP